MQPIVYTSFTSPFGRSVRVCLYERGIEHQVIPSTASNVECRSTSRAIPSPRSRCSSMMIYLFTRPRPSSDTSPMFPWRSIGPK